MQEYVNVDYSSELSIVGLSGKSDDERIVAEGRLFRNERSNSGEVAFLIQDDFQGIGVGSYMLSLFIAEARDQGMDGLTAEVIADNQAMIRFLKRHSSPWMPVLKTGSIN